MVDIIVIIVFLENWVIQTIFYIKDKLKVLGGYELLGKNLKLFF